MDIKLLQKSNWSGGTITLTSTTSWTCPSNVNKIKVFAMGEDSQDFLVKNDDKLKPGLGDYQSTVA